MLGGLFNCFKAPEHPSDKAYGAASADPYALSKLLASTSLNAVVGNKRGRQGVVIIRDTATVEQALQTLAAHKILSAPVVSENGSEGVEWPADKGLTGRSSIVGFVDVSDILNSFLLELQSTDLSDMKMLKRMRILEEKGAEFAGKQIKDLPVFGGDGDFFHVSQGKEATVQDFISFGLLHPKDRVPSAPSSRANSLTRASSGISPNKLQPAAVSRRGTTEDMPAHLVVHRVATYNNSFQIDKIISQTDILRFVCDHHRALGPLQEQSVEDMGWTCAKVVTVTPETSAIDAMKLMAEKKISAVAVVDAAGKIIGNFSASEMRTMMAEHFGSLALPVGEFLALEHGTEFVGYSRSSDMDEKAIADSAGHKFVTDRVNRQRPRTPGEEVGQSLVLVGPETTFLSVVRAITSHRIHRVYVIGADERPVGVVTCTDVLRKLLAEAQRQDAAELEADTAASNAVSPPGAAL